VYPHLWTNLSIWTELGLHICLLSVQDNLLKNYGMISPWHGITQDESKPSRYLPCPLMHELNFVGTKWTFAILFAENLCTSHLWGSEWDSEEIKLHKPRDIQVKIFRIEELWPCNWNENFQTKFAYISVFFALQNKNQKQKSNMQVKENLGHMHKDLPWSSVITKFLEP